MTWRISDQLSNLLDGLTSEANADTGHRKLRNKLHALHPNERASLLREIGVTPWNSEVFGSVNVQAHDLLAGMMQALGVSPWQASLRTRRDLEQTCIFCPNAQRCAWELSSGSPEKTLESFCPNAQTLLAMRHRQTGMETTGMPVR
jgi:hypothetical protein